jgi:hypothetical protein
VDANTPNDQLPRNELWNQLGIAAQSRSSEDQTLLATFGIFCAANAVLLGALFTSGDLPKNPLVSISFAGVGVAASVAWFLVQRRALGHISRYEGLMQLLEQELGVPARLAVSARINEQLYKAHLRGAPPARFVMTVCSIVVAIAWLAFLLISLILLVAHLAGGR